jgi:energy-coupling factor transport system ATP-binding protein
VAEHATAFALLSEGSIQCSAGKADDPGLHESLARAGILPRPQRPRAGKEGKVFLSAKGLRFRFPEAGPFSLEVDSLELRTGEVCALLGSNGSGKSTLGRILCGLLAPQAGTLTLHEGAPHPAQGEELSGSVGYLFQNPDHQIYLPTVHEELALGLRRQGASRRDIEMRVAEAIELFSLPGPLAPPALMSYGARRRLQAATYYLLSRKLLILDEVDSGLSCREVEMLLDALVMRAPGILLITHDLTLARSVADRILSMEAGRITSDLRPGLDGAAS